MVEGEGAKFNPEESGAGKEVEATPYQHRVVELFEQGLDSDDIYAFHGTSMAAIEYLAEHGQMPSSGAFGKVFHYLPQGLDPKENAEEVAKNYARMCVFRDYVRQNLPFKLGPARERDLFILNVQYDEDEPAVQRIHKECEKHGLSIRDFEKIIAKARKVQEQEAVVIGISGRVKDHYRERKVVLDERCVKTEQGLPIDYVVGIEPVGQGAWDRLEKMQDEIKGT